MKNYIIVLCLLLSLPLVGQNMRLKINGATDLETLKIDSIGYVAAHDDYKTIAKAIATLSGVVQAMGYLRYTIEANTSADLNVALYTMHLGQQTKQLRIYVADDLKVPAGLRQDTVVIQFTENEVFLRSILSNVEKKGFSMAKLKLDRLVWKGSYMSADLKIELNKKRRINDIIVNGYELFSKGHLNNLKRLYRNKTFTAQTLEQLYVDVGQYRFVKQLKYPEILFTDNATKIYVYVEKAKNNTFDGFLGFTNDEKKNFVLSGYVDLALNNILNSGENLAINWRSNGTEQRTFNIGIELPYVFKSPLALKANLNIIKQDSTFQTTQTGFDIGYYLNLNTKIYVGYQASESSDIRNTNTGVISDFTNEFVTTNFDFSNYKNEVVLFPEKTNLSFKVGAGRRNSKFNSNAQYFVNAMAKHYFYLNDKNGISVKSQSYYLKSDQYISNELYRFGGINTIRGFNDNSLQASFLTSVMTEYRYIITPNLYIHSIIDYGIYQDKATNSANKLLGIGLGFGLLTKNGLLNLVYANGSTENQAIQLSASIVQISLKARF